MNNESHDSDRSNESEEEVELQTPFVRRYGQARKKNERYSPPHFFSSFTLSASKEDSRTIKEAINSTKGKFWNKAMEEEMESLRKNDTWDIVTLPNGRRSIASKWVFKRRRKMK